MHLRPARRLVILAFLWCALATSLGACVPSSGGTAGGIVLAGSTSVQPFAELLAEEYAREHPSEPVINIQGGGSTAGIEAALSGTAEIGMSSRALREAELAEGLSYQPIAYDAIAVVVHQDNPISSLTSEQVRQIFSGEITTWSQLGGPERPITLITREEGSGTRGAFEELLMQDSRISDRALRQDSNGAVRVIVNSDPAAIGYMSLGIVGTFVKPVALDGVQPTTRAAIEGEYALVRPFLFVWRGELSPPARKFVDYCLSPPAQGILSGEGLIPVEE
ncbi:MAG: phosphate ABC transporter substrate-binding protein [Anaerolineae bacterium]|nr:phosphate ABC transporter substrate-binding protein [Anaerolineae bacterium]